MLLTDPAVQYWSCVVAILATLAVLMLWNRVRGPRVVKGLSRLGLLLAGYLATAVAVLVSVNIAYGGLVVSVNDLFADLNPPMGQYPHHHRQCGSGPAKGQGQGQQQAGASAAAPYSAPALAAPLGSAPLSSAAPGDPAADAEQAAPADPWGGPPCAPGSSAGARAAKQVQP